MINLHRLTRRILARVMLLNDTISTEAIDRLLHEEAPDVSEHIRTKIKLRVWASLHDASDRIVTVVPENCDCSGDEQHCTSACAVNAITQSPGGKIEILDDRCVDCGLCVDACDSGAIVEKTQCRELAQMMASRQEYPLYAILAPAFAGQFGSASPPQVKAALRRLGFTDVYEVALAADILTTLEADEFIERSLTGGHFMITSCCCPAFIRLVEKHRPKVAHLISEAVSPMIALGRMLKGREPHCRVVFIGPCLAKRAEARRVELRDAIDTVLTFKETIELLSLANIDVLSTPPDTTPLMEASRDGRNYAHTGGVTEAIRNAVEQQRPEIDINALIGNGLKQCNEILGQVEDGSVDGNFMEGMGCPGGCVGGPGTIIPVLQGASTVRSFALRARRAKARDNELASEWFYNYGGKEMLLSYKSAATDVDVATGHQPGRQ